MDFVTWVESCVDALQAEAEKERASAEPKLELVPERFPKEGLRIKCERFLRKVAA